MEHNNLAWRSTGTVHVCNCIGCCDICGHCRTDPKHSPEACRKIAKAKQTIRESLS